MNKSSKLHRCVLVLLALLTFFSLSGYDVEVMAQQDGAQAQLVYCLDDVSGENATNDNESHHCCVGHHYLPQMNVMALQYTELTSDQPFFVQMAYLSPSYLLKRPPRV